MSLIPAPGRQTQVDHYDFEAILIYILNFRTAKATKREPVSKMAVPWWHMP